MKLIVGLGNPGERYSNTFHNVGREFIDFVARKNNLQFKEDFDGLFSSFKSHDETIFLLQPQTFMNQSGESVVKAAKFYKIQPGDIYLVFDDLDLPLGSYKVQIAKYPKCHNGVNSVIRSIGSDSMVFVRIGIETRDRKVPDLAPKGSEYVLRRHSYDFSQVYQAILDKLNL